MGKNKLRLDINNNIHVLRAEAKITQQQLADAIGVTRATANSIEKGNYNPSLELAFLIARHFGKRIEEVFHIIEGEEE